MDLYRVSPHLPLTRGLPEVPSGHLRGKKCLVIAGFCYCAGGKHPFLELYSKRYCET
jgi:hypothetical protein